MTERLPTWTLKKPEPYLTTGRFACVPEDSVLAVLMYQGHPGMTLTHPLGLAR